MVWKFLSTVLSEYCPCRQVFQPDVYCNSFRSHKAFVCRVARPDSTPNGFLLFFSPRPPTRFGRVDGKETKSAEADKTVKTRSTTPYPLLHEKPRRGISPPARVAPQTTFHSGRYTRSDSAFDLVFKVVGERRVPVNRQCSFCA
jgi:hypothetical protein